MGFKRHHSVLIVASTITVASFVGATTYTQDRLARLDALSSTLETNAMPSIESLSRASVRLTRLSQLLDDAAVSGPRRASTLAEARQEVTALEDDVSRYVQLPTLPGERNLWAGLRADVDDAVRLARMAIGAAEQGPASSQKILQDGRVDDALDGAVRTVLATLDFDVQQSKALARDVRSVRAATLRTIVALDAAATAVALFGLFVAYRASRRHDQLLHEHASLLTVRVAELDRFAGRVAHDVLSPLGTITTALSLLAHSADARGQTYIDRSQRALQRVQQLVEGLLMFARSGARPDPDTRCSVDDVLRTIVADCAEAAVEKQIELVAEPRQSMQVPCSLGVTTSITQNLVRNAIKYLGDRQVRRIVIRARPVGRVVRIEVEDIGPGIPADLQATIFEPFVRGSHEHVSGTGLGLATVKRLVESHGGAVGVRSEVGVGSLFWVELPLVAAKTQEMWTATAAHHV